MVFVTGVGGVGTLAAHGVLVEVVGSRVVESGTRVRVVSYWVLQANTGPTPYHHREPRRLVEKRVVVKTRYVDTNTFFNSRISVEMGFAVDSIFHNSLLTSLQNSNKDILRPYVRTCTA